MEKYQVGESIYGGPIAVVHKATEKSSGNSVALKEVDIDLCTKPHNVRREILFLKALKHPGILELLDSFEYGDSFYLVTPLYAFDLDQWLKRCSKKRMKFNFNDPINDQLSTTNTFPIDRAHLILLLLALALEFLHIQQGIIHRDIKPSNIFFHDESSEPVLGDFGIAYDTLSPPADEPPDRKYTDVSTGIYKAPELCFGFTDYSFTIDIWSLGIMMTVLYSQDGESCLDTNGNFHELSLIHSIFCNFGTPLVSDSSDPRTYWPEAALPQSHFTKFNFKKHVRRHAADMLPRCRESSIIEAFDRIMVFRLQNRMNAGELVTCLKN